MVRRRLAVERVRGGAHVLKCLGASRVIAGSRTSRRTTASAFRGSRLNPWRIYSAL